MEVYQDLKVLQMTRNNGMGGAIRCQRGCKYVTRKKEEVFKGRQEGLETAILKCDKPEHAAQFMARLTELALNV